MFDNSNVLTNKLFMRIRRSDDAPETRDVVDIVLGTLYKQICHLFNSTLDWKSFVWGGVLSDQNLILGGMSAVASTQDNRTIWAASLHVKDQYWRRRCWNYYFGIRQTDENEVMLSYAKCCYDHLAGSLNSPVPLPDSRDTLPDCLFFEPGLQCIVGSYAYPLYAQELNHATFEDFIDIVYDEKRTLPVMLVTCPDIIVPEKLYDLVYGNIILYWCINSEIVARLNSVLHQDMFTPWDSVRLFMPITRGKAFHPIYTYDDIRRIGTANFVAAIRQAYCRSMRNEDRKQFPMVEDIFALRSRMRIAELCEQFEQNRQQLEESNTKLEQVSDELANVRQQLEIAQKTSDRDSIPEYESLLNDTLLELDALKKGISNLSTRLYGTMGKGFTPDEGEASAILQELSHAIYAAISCAASKR